MRKEEISAVEKDRLSLLVKGARTKEDQDALRLVSNRFLKNVENYVQRVSGEKSFRRFFWQRLILSVFSNFPTMLGVIFRGISYQTLLGSIGNNCIIEKNVRMIVPRQIFIGRGVLIGENTRLDAGTLEGRIVINDNVSIDENCLFKLVQGEIILGEHVFVARFCHFRGSGNIEVGKNCLIGQNTQVYSAEHIYKDPSIPINYQGVNVKRVKIGEDVWLGANVTVLAGVTIGDGAVVGAGSLVNKDIPPYGIAVGMPARIIGTRG